MHLSHSNTQCSFARKEPKFFVKFFLEQTQLTTIPKDAKLKIENKKNKKK